MPGTFYDQAAAALPNFPREVIDLWFWHAEPAGWPPAVTPQGYPTAIWGNVLGRARAFSFWTSVSWTLGRIQLTPGLLEPETGSFVTAAANGFLAGLPPIPNLTTRDYGRRIANNVVALQRLSHLARRPVLLSTSAGLEVLDGTHRIAALFVAQSLRIRLDPLHEVWIANAT